MIILICARDFINTLSNYGFEGKKSKPHIWNHFDVTVYRRNNVCEGFHSKVNKMLRCKPKFVNNLLNPLLLFFQPYQLQMNLNFLLLNLQIILLFFQPFQLRMNLNLLLLNQQIHYSASRLIKKDSFRI